MSITLRVSSLLFLLYLAFSLFLGGCCTRSARIIGLGVPQFRDTAWNILDTLEGEFILMVDHEMEVASVQAPSLYAFSCGWDNLNLLDTNSLRLELDRPLPIGAEILPAGTDLLAHPLTGPLLVDEVIQPYEFSGYIAVRFGTAFRLACSLPDGPIGMTLRAATDDGKVFSVTASAYWKG